MFKRFVSIWFRHLQTDWMIIRQPSLKKVPFVLADKVKNRRLITAVNILAENEGITTGLPVADAEALLPGLQVFDEKHGRRNKLLKGLAEWAIRYTPVVAADPPDGLLLDVSGCTHLWGGEREYLADLTNRLRTAGYDVRAAIADTAGLAWGIARYGRITPIIESGCETTALMILPPAALRLEQNTLDKLHKLGLTEIGSFMQMPAAALRRRFGRMLLLRLGQALGHEEENLQPVVLPAAFEERLPCPEPICTATGIEIAITMLLEKLCPRLKSAGKGIRTAVLKCYRLDGNIQEVQIGTNRATHHIPHLFKLFALKTDSIAPDLGIELFTLEAVNTDDVQSAQDQLWAGAPGLQDADLAELLDRIDGKIGTGHIRHYLPSQHYWPENSYRQAKSLDETSSHSWPSNRPRPLYLLKHPELIQVTAPIPDYPPMNFRYKGTLHEMKKADAVERIESEWWLQEGLHRDYYLVEDQEGRRYWVFRLGHYSDRATAQWFIHGFFA